MRIFSNFVAKALAAAGLVVLGDFLFWREDGLGSNLGVFALAWACVTLALTPATWRSRGGAVAAITALLLGGALLDSPTLPLWVLFCAALAMAVLLPRFAAFDHAGRWLARVVYQGVISLIGPWRDLLRLGKLRRGKRSFGRLLPLLPLPLIGGAIFLMLFAGANPLIGNAIQQIGLPSIESASLGRLLLWAVLLTLVWATLRPRRSRLLTLSDHVHEALPIPGVTVGSVTLALLTFNALFALQNGLDIAFLWSGAPLPAGVTLADYAHRGAYPLIATALLAGLFVLVTLRPGSETAAVPAIRRLVLLWIVQNIFLVASSILRTVDYIEVYSLTGLRIAALIWMALVALGLALIVLRLFMGKSSAWLINTNSVAALLALIAGSVVDLGSVAAAWNVTHAREAGGKGAALDLCYLRQLGPSALTSLVAIEQRPGLDHDFAARVAWVRHIVYAETIKGQSDGWRTWRNARRLEQVYTMMHGMNFPAPPTAGPNGRGCDGVPNRPPPSAVDPSAAEAPAAASDNMAETALTNEASQ